MSKSRAYLVLCCLGALAAPLARADVPLRINHQGLILDASGQPRNGIANVELYVWAHPTSIASEDFLYSEVHAAVPVIDGVYQVDLGAGTRPVGTLGAQTFAQANRWLEVILEGEILTPRQRITSVPYSIQSQQCVDTSRLEGRTLAQVISDARTGLTFANIGGVVGESQLVGVVRIPELLAVLLGVDGAGSGVDADRLDGIDSAGFTQLGQSIESDEISDGSVTSADLAPNSVGPGQIDDGSIFDLDVSPGAAIRGSKIDPDFGSQNLSTTGWIGNELAGQRAEVRAGLQASLVLAPGSAALPYPSVLLGSATNVVGAGVVGAVVLGGGFGVNQNSVFDHLGTIGGGNRNQTGSADADLNNGQSATVAGGAGNRASGSTSTVAGGLGNIAAGDGSFIGGGFNSLASGDYSVVPGGRANSADGDYSFAAGYGAAASHPGSFVWSDGSQGGASAFASSGANQFLIQATGGVGIGTNLPLGVLQLGSPAEFSAFRLGNASARHHLISNRDLVINTFDADTSNSGTPLFLVRRNTSKFNENTWADLLHVDDTGALTISGAAFKPGGGAWSVASDARLKQDVRPLEGALDSLLALRGVRFEYKDPEAIHELAGERIGFVAQDVEPVFPDWVSTGADGYRRLTVRGFEALTVEAMRELRAQNDELREQNDELRQRLERIERRLAVVAARE